MAIVEIRRIGSGPALLIEDAERLALDFFRHDPSSALGGYDDLAGRGEADRVTTRDIVAINTTIRARSPHKVWETLTEGARAHGWLEAVDPGWDLIDLDDRTWKAQARQAVESALSTAIAPGRGLSVASKVLHLKRPRLFPVLDRLVLEQLGVTQSVPPMRVIDHLRRDGRRNMQPLQAVRESVSPYFDRPLIRILDALLWASHPAAGISPKLVEWQHVVRRQNS
jgi:hypothetical protein